MNKYYTFRYLDSKGNLLGYRADTSGSLRKDWSKTYSTLKTANKIFNDLKARTLDKQQSHDLLALVLGKYNSAGAAIVSSTKSKDVLKNTDSATLQLLQCDGYDGFNNNCYSTDDFGKLVKTAKVINSHTF